VSDVSTQVTMEELEQAGERELGTSSWVAVEQRQIDLFAEATGDFQWIHVDSDAAAQGPFGRTIAHGYLTLSLLPVLLSEVMSVTGARMGVNYGVNRVRFTSPVPSGSRVRLHARLLGGERRPNGVLFRVGVEVEIEGGDRPALVGEVLSLAYQ
jgi:acyl dehydratase